MAIPTTPPDPKQPTSDSASGPHEESVGLTDEEFDRQRRELLDDSDDDSNE